MAVQDRNAALVNHISSVSFPQRERHHCAVSQLVLLSVKLGSKGQKVLKEEAEIQGMTSGNDGRFISGKAPLAKVLHSRETAPSNLLVAMIQRRVQVLGKKNETFDKRREEQPKKNLFRMKFRSSHTQCSKLLVGKNRRSLKRKQTRENAQKEDTGQT